MCSSAASSFRGHEFCFFVGRVANPLSLEHDWFMWSSDRIWRFAGDITHRLVRRGTLLAQASTQSFEGEASACVNGACLLNKISVVNDLATGAARQVALCGLYLRKGLE